MRIAQLQLIAMFCCVTLFASAGTCSAETVIDRPGTMLSPNIGNFPTSSFSASDFLVMDGVPVYGRRAYDRFTVPSAAFPLGADISRVSWEMIVWNSVTQLPPGPLQATSYDVRFYASDSGQPAANLYSVTFAPSELTTTLLGIYTAPGGNGHNGQVYRVTSELPNVFRAAPDTEFWLSWMAYTPTFRPVYGWTGQDSNSPGHALQDRLDQNGQPIFRVDWGNTLHYTLEGTAVPEPSGLVLAAMSVVGVAIVYFVCARRVCGQTRGA